MSDPADSDSRSPAAGPCHFVQVGETPVFVGAGDSDLTCRCGQSVLIKGYLPQNYLAIRVKCFRCGAVTTTPGLADCEVLPPGATAIERGDVPAVTPSMIARGMVLVCRQEMTTTFELTRPRDPPSEPMILSAAALERCAAEYDGLTGGALAEHLASARRTVTLDASDYPFAWALDRLRDRVGRDRWAWFSDNDDTMAALHVAALRHFLHCWGHHPRLGLIASPLREPGAFLRTMASLATAKLLFDAGNRIAFSAPAAGRFDAVPHISTGGEAFALAMRFPAQLQWRERHRSTSQSLRASVEEALASAQGAVNRNKPGILVLSASILRPDFDQALFDAINLTLRTVGRKHRGVAAVASIMPRVAPMERPEQIGFAYMFHPIRNKHFAGDSPIRIGSEQDFAALRAGHRP